MNILKSFAFITLIGLLHPGCHEKSTSGEPQSYISIEQDDSLMDFSEKLSRAAIQIIDPAIRYVPDYRVLDYPGGDVPAHTGVCTDVVIRAYRKLGIDLQKEVHEDMTRNFGAYPRLWNRSQPDRNIDHRRVPNLMTFFSRHGTVKPISDQSKDFIPGDIVCWELPNGMTHIGIVVHKRSLSADRPMVVHNIGGGQVMEDCLFSYQMIGHYSYSGKQVH